MVEAAGIEPASESSITETSTSVVPVLVSRLGYHRNKTSKAPALLNFPGWWQSNRLPGSPDL